MRFSHYNAFYIFNYSYFNSKIYLRRITGSEILNLRQCIFLFYYNTTNNIVTDMEPILNYIQNLFKY